jgi:hypothetical protein
MSEARRKVQPAMALRVLQEVIEGPAQRLWNEAAEFLQLAP